MKHGVYEILVRCGYSYCARCEHVLPVKAFHADPKRARGLNAYCCACKQTYRTGKRPDVAPILRLRRRWYWQALSDLRWVLERSGLSYCTIGDHILPFSAFHADAALKTGRHSDCKGCRAAAREERKRRAGR